MLWFPSYLGNMSYYHETQLSNRWMIDGFNYFTSKIKKFIFLVSKKTIFKMFHFYFFSTTIPNYEVCSLQNQHFGTTLLFLRLVQASRQESSSSSNSSPIFDFSSLNRFFHDLLNMVKTVKKMSFLFVLRKFSY